jgi:integrase
VSPSTYNQHIGFLRLLWKVLRSRVRGDGNPWDTIRRRNLVSQSRRELTVDELRAICRAATGETRLLLALGIYTGMRLGDCATLRWGEVDLHRAMIRRVPTKVARRKPTPISIPIHAVLGTMLKDVKPLGDAVWVLPETAALYQEDSSAMAKRIQDHFEACGVRTHRPGTGFKTVTAADGKPKEEHTGKRAVVEVGFHSLRHTFVSLCREANAPLSVVEAIVGHSNPAMTRLYTHTSEAAAGAAVAALPDITGQAAAPTLPAPAKRPFDGAALKALVDGLTARNLTETKAKLQMLLAAG